MSNIIFPAGFSIDLPDLNMEMMQHYSKMWNLEHTKLGKGFFEGSISAIHTPRIQLATACYSLGFMSKGDFPDGCVVLIYSTREAVYNFQNRSISPNEIIILTKGDEVDILTADNISVHTIVIEEDLFYKTFHTFFGDTPDVSIQKKCLMLNPDTLSLFHQSIAFWTSYLKESFPKLTAKPEYQKIESEILRQIFSYMICTPVVKQRKKFQTKMVRDLLHKNIDDFIDIPMIANELNISECQLHTAFKKEYGITPKRYLQLLRLNAINKELLLANQNLVTISDIAQKYSFLHMGHFSSEYKKLFGETPSQTLHYKI